MNVLLINEKSSQLKNSLSSTVFFSLVALITLSLMMATIWQAYPYFLASFGQWQKYFNFTWAHETQLLSDLLQLLGLVWVLVSTVFWGSWLLRRLVRKMTGLQWKVRQKGDVSSSYGYKYLKYSCHYLALVLLFFILQYPLQFIIFTS